MADVFEINCATAFEIRGSTRRDPNEGVGVESGDTLFVTIQGVSVPVPVVVTKTLIDSEGKQVFFFSTGLVKKIEKTLGV
jgi:hypothetical protein